MEQKLRLTDVIVDNKLNPREGALDQEAITEYAANIEALPPMHLFMIEGKYYLTRGFHRYAAHQLAGVDEATFVCHSGAMEDAQEDADLDNLKHGLRLNRAEKRAVIERYLRRHPDRSDVWVARECHTTDKTVRSVRQALEESSEIPKLDKLTGQDGVERPRNVQRASAPEPVVQETEVEEGPLPQWLDEAPPAAVAASPAPEPKVAAPPPEVKKPDPPQAKPAPPPPPPPVISEAPLTLEATVRSGSALVSARRGEEQLAMESVTSAQVGEKIQTLIEQHDTGGNNGNAV